MDKDFYKRNKSFCPKAFKEIYVDSAGRYRLCCHARPKKDNIKWDKNLLPFDYFFSEEMEDYRQMMFEGEQIPECKTCYDMEENADISYRKMTIDNYNQSGTINDITVKVRAFGNYCNLSCYMCHPYNSTTRQKEVNEIFSDSELYDKFVRAGGMTSKPKRNKMDDFEQYMKHILDNIHLIKKFQMIGGETLQLPKNWEFLERIPDKYAKNINLSLETNLTKIEYKDHNIQKLARKFKHIFCGVSVDHFGVKNEFIRYPINQIEFEENIMALKKMENINFKFNATVSFLNIDDIFEIKNYYNRKFRNLITFHNIVRGPDFLSIRNLPPQLKNEYIKKYKDYPYILAELRQPNNMPIDTSFEYCDKLANHREMDWRNAWSDFIDKIKISDNIIVKC